MGVRHVSAGLDLQDDRGAGGARGRHRPRRDRLLPRLPQAWQTALPLLAKRRPWADEHAGIARAILRRLLLRDGASDRHRQDRGYGGAARAWRREQAADTLDQLGADPDPRLEAREPKRGMAG